MKPPNAAWLATTLAALLGASCSPADSGSDGASTAGLPESVSGLCTGTITRAIEYFILMPGSVAKGSKRSLPAGTKVLIAGFDAGEEGVAYVNGAPVWFKLDAGDLEPDCDLSAFNTGDSDAVVLAPATLWEREDYSGQRCPLEVGQRFASYSAQVRDGGYEFSYSDPTPPFDCSIASGFSKDLIFKRLYAVP